MRTALAGQSDPEDPDPQQQPSPPDNQSDRHDENDSPASDPSSRRRGINRGPGWPRRRI
ncbi:hypothetical protein [Micromonospora sp. NPDC004704]